MEFKHLKYRVDMPLSQTFKTVVTESYLHYAIFNIAKKSKAYTKIANGKQVNVYIVLLDTIKKPQAVNQMKMLIEKHFEVTQLEDNHFYLS
ncbi:hypothetical protein [Pectobacterium polaris]|uniref:hypothetical protein n=1 Tax=Pectobacterium polaris TaxID=2042057 RepID=UPI001CF3A8B5|nr:hypothetical protein [Pectobacterium polaris]MCA6954674.1 hypothetical protein [Pectobacterium polaris]